MDPERLRSVLENLVRNAIELFHTDTGAWPAALADLSATAAPASGKDSAGAAKSINAPDWHGPYLRTVFATVGLTDFRLLRLERLRRGPEAVDRATGPHGVATAVFDPTRTFRYRLSRTWDREGPVVAFVMLNPSTADAEVLDPTVRRCVGFARAWEFGSLEVVNLFAFRATDPRDLLLAAAPVGPDNDQAIVDAASAADRVVAAWGTRGRWCSLTGHKGDQGDILKVHRRFHGHSPVKRRRVASSRPSWDCSIKASRFMD